MKNQDFQITSAEVKHPGRFLLVLCLSFMILTLLVASRSKSSHVEALTLANECPVTDTGVIFYRDQDYGCAGKGEGSGYVEVQNSTWGNFNALTFNDKASSLLLDTEHSVLLFEHTYLRGGKFCADQSLSKLANHQFNNGVSLNDNISSYFLIKSAYDCSFFQDVDWRDYASLYINILKLDGFVAGCNSNPPQFCPNNGLLRSEMAVFVMRGVHGADYVSPKPNTQVFADVSLGHWGVHWITDMWEKGYTAGCHNPKNPADPVRFCPNQKHIRAEAAVFFLRIKHKPSYTPPKASCNVFVDVGCSIWYADWVEEAYERPLVGPRLMFECTVDPLRFCPDAVIKRDEAAHTMVRAKGLLPVYHYFVPLTSNESEKTTVLIPADLAQTNANLKSSLYHRTDFGTFLGGSGEDVGYGAAIDIAGNQYFVGYTDSPDFPFTTSFSTNLGDRDGFVAKLNATTNLPDYIAALGGSESDVAKAVVSDAMDNVYIVGYTESSDFPTKNAAQAAHGGERDAFVTKINAAGDLVYSTYLGGTDTDEVRAIAVDNQGNVYLTGETYSVDFPVTATAWQGTIAGGYDVFVAKLDENGGLLYSTYLGGQAYEGANNLTLDDDGNIYLVGETYSTDFPTKNAVQDTSPGGSDGFVTKMNPAGQVLYSTFIGGSGGDLVNSIAVDQVGAAYLTGMTASMDFPITNPMQSSHGGSATDAFVVKLNAQGDHFAYSTYLGGSSGEEGISISVNNEGQATITGNTFSEDFPTINRLNSASGKSRDLFITRLAADGGGILASFFINGNAGDYNKQAVVLDDGTVYMTGFTLSEGFPIQDAFQTELSGTWDAYFVRITTDYRVFITFLIK